MELEELRKHFHKPEKQVAVELGMCLTSLKKVCRNLGVHRWPHRKVIWPSLGICHIQPSRASFVALTSLPPCWEYQTMRPILAPDPEKKGTGFIFHFVMK